MAMDKQRAIQGDSGAFVRRVLIVIAIIALALLFWQWRHVFLLLFASIMIALALHGVADPIARRTGLNKGWSLGLATLVVLGLLIGIGWLFGAQVGAQIQELSARLPEALARVQALINGRPEGAQFMQQVQEWAGGQGAGVVGRVGNWTMSVVGGATTALLVIAAAAFFAIDPKTYRDGFLILFRQPLRDQIGEAMEHARRALRKWLLGTVISMLFIAVTIGTGLYFLGVPAFAALGAIAGLSQFVPLIGPLLASVPGILLALTLGPDTAIWTALLYFATAQVEANLVTPSIQKRAVSLPPALILFSVIAMGILFGPLGVLFAVPLTVVIAILVAQLYLINILGEDVKVPGADS
jgi:predicted PurR-regulated permease PerM